MCAKYHHQQIACERCSKKTRLPLVPITSARTVILRVCGRCSMEIKKGGPLYLRKPPPDA